MAGYKWADAVITWGFTTSQDTYSSRYGHGELSNGYEALSADQQAAVRAIMGLYQGYLDVELRYVGGSAAASADIRIAQSNAPKTAWAYYPGADEGGDVWFNASLKSYDKPVIGSYGWMTFLHEIGHAFGLKHGHEAEGDFDELPGHQDSLEYTVMTYRSHEGAGVSSFSNGAADYPQTLMMLDIRALQELYGANFSQAGRSLTYSWSPTTGETFINGVSQGAVAGNRIFMTVWSAGADVTYDLSDYAGDLEIDLRPGEWSVFSDSQLARLDRSGKHLAEGNVANAELFEQGGVDNLIRNAIGGAGDDLMIGNAADNALTGGKGDDRLEGGGGQDTAVFSGKVADYYWAKAADGSLVVTDLRDDGDGADTLVGVEWLRFSDSTLEATARSQPAPSKDQQQPSPPATQPVNSGGQTHAPAPAPTAPAPVFDLEQAFRNVLQTSPEGSALYAELKAGLEAGTVSQAAALDRLIEAADSTTSVVTMTYQFFTGAAPGGAGMEWLLSADGPNPNSLNSAFYAGTSMEHRFISFAVALATSGASGEGFAAEYGALSAGDALAKAYAEIFGL
ncbi:MAG TPA: M10 family metallopeptidase, partial [Allosphingosinicella sp.]|nr:M10 family metallopeptidase [Allosphingosinicella sp.]